MAKPRIVIIGGGFAGVTLAQHLLRRSGSAVEVVLISPANHMVFTPMLSEVIGRTLLEHEDGWRPVSVKAEASLSVAWLGEEDLRRLRPVLAALQRTTGMFSAAIAALPNLMPDLGRAPVSAAMARPPRTLPQALGMKEALSRLAGGHPGCPVVDDRGELVGYCGTEDLSRALAGGRRTAEARVGDIMRKDAAALPEDRSVAEAAVLRHRGDALAITAADGSGQVVGTLTRFDLIRWALAAIEQTEPGQAAAMQNPVAT